MRSDIQGPYWTDRNSFCKDVTKKDGGGAVQLTNFLCKIDQQLIYHDGPRTTTLLKISGKMNDEEETPLPEITIDATDLRTLTWIPKLWGMKPIVYPEPGAERDVCTMMQIISDPIRSDIYTHTGWTEIAGKRAYLSMDGAITGDKPITGITVSLPYELNNYSLPKAQPNVEAIKDSFRLINLGPKNVMWPLLLATYRAAIGPTDFAIHLAGRTGTFKSELASLMQSHYGIKMDARHLPASWNSTANALEALAYKAKDALFVVDDFVPVGTAWQVRNLQGKADQFIRGQGNQAGRTRLTDTSSLQQTMYPRGIILSTGEDIPDGHSIRARMLICELSPGEIPTDRLTAAQNARPSYSAAMADWIQWLAGTDAHTRIKPLADEIRDRNQGIGHSRTPPIIGDLLATSILMTEWCEDREYFSANILGDLTKKATDAIMDAGNRQRGYLQSSDPVTAFTATIRQVFGTQLAHAKTRNGGIPANPPQYGWIQQEIVGEIASWKSNGPRIGWVDLEKNEFLFDPNALNFIRKHANGALAVTPQTFLKRLKDAGLITRTDSARERNTIRVILEGHTHNVVALNLDEVMTEDE